MLLSPPPSGYLHCRSETRATESCDDKFPFVYPRVPVSDRAINFSSLDVVSPRARKQRHAIIQDPNSVMFRFHQLPEETVRNLISNVAAAAWRHYALSLNPASGATPDDRYSRNVGWLPPLEYPWKLSFAKYSVSPFILTLRHSNKMHSRRMKM